CSYNYDADVPQPIKAIMGKVPGQRKPEEKAALEEYKQKGVKELARVKVPQAAVYAVAFAPDGETVAAAGADGVVRLISVKDGKVVKQFAPAPLGDRAQVKAEINVALTYPQEKAEKESLPKGAPIIGLDVQPKQIDLTSAFTYAQVLVTARLSGGELCDATRAAKLTPSAAVI